jgi:hypothetical protein
MDWILSPFNKFIMPQQLPQLEKTEHERYLDTIYHEKQVKELCAVHALNNLFQESFFSKSLLDDICLE